MKELVGNSHCDLAQSHKIESYVTRSLITATFLQRDQTLAIDGTPVSNLDPRVHIRVRFESAQMGYIIYGYLSIRYDPKNRHTCGIWVQNLDPNKKPDPASVQSVPDPLAVDRVKTAGLEFCENKSSGSYHAKQATTSVAGCKRLHMLLFSCRALNKLSPCPDPTH